MLLALFVITPAARSSLITTDPALPPDGDYVSPDGSFAYSGVGVILDDPILRPLVATAVLTPVGADEQEDFNATFDAVEIGLGLGSLQLTGSVSVMTFGKIGNTTGTFQTEIISMSLTGTTSMGSVIIREDPGISSLGQTTITNLGGGLYEIDSFFDVFTELSFDGGNNWFACDAPTQLGVTPEPATICLFALGGMLLRKRRE
jgi:hypothetical protein